nr:YadA-like family protein [Shewanella schlegeliana]
MTNALSGLPQPYGVGKVQVGVGLGFASDKKAVAIGMGYRATDAVVIRAGISKSAGSRGDVQGNLAVGYEF